MATFEVERLEGCQWIKATLRDETVRTERGALNHMRGDLKMDMPLPSPREAFISLFSVESMFRPRFRGTGEIYLESSLGGFYSLQVTEGEPWIVEDGAYWASEQGIRLSFHRERVVAALWAGEGLFWYQSKVSGSGQVVLATSGDVEEVVLNDEQLTTEGRYVLARTAGLRLDVRRPARGLLGYFYSGESRMRVYHGTGRLLLSATPNWRLRMAQNAAAGVFKYL
ncbi:AIM24 family protein [Paludisphaera rhizosphaerae]|uniref:AIM24 family protein n=1 Tax=Paludisphaera rhizosphaerae TaxID=2711216 RepID=UPI0013ED2998|nr:AIM24 family protein [Paludisphaera rhizosphaerae]